jgi:tRNA pseudouridine32 synthase / 23S rRNA pseudouridine746 synthase
VRILHREQDLLIVDKPAGVLTVPGRGDDSRPLIAEVRELEPGALAVHRLDRDTSGVVVFALGKQAHRALNAVFEGRRAEKGYLALVQGDLARARRIDLPLVEARRGGMRVAESGEKGALSAVTEVAPEERFGNYTLCTCRPRTGRTHQIRVHLAAAGHPLAVDPRYGSKRPLRVGDLWQGAPDPDTIVLERTPLHACSLRIPLPGRRGWLSVESPLSDDIARCLDLLRATRRSA